MAAPLASVSVRHDSRRIVAEFASLREDIATRATVRALNKALDKVATETSREIRKVYNVRHRAIIRALRKRRAHSRSLFARLIVEGVKLGLIHFEPRAVNPWNVKGRPHRPGGGVSVRIKTGGERELFPGAFIAVTRGRRVVWRRQTRERGSVKTLRSISVPQAFADEAVLTALRAWATRTFNKELLEQINLLATGRRR